LQAVYLMLSVIIPVLDEAESLPQLYRELDAFAARESYDLQIIFIDDGSRDATWSTIEALAAADERVLGIRFRRNFGKTAALAAGFDAASGERIITLDADLQDDPAEIPRLLAKLDEGYDLVNGWKRHRHDPLPKVVASRGFNWLVSGVTGVKLHDHNCGLKCMRRELVHELKLFSDLHRFIPVLAAARGFRVAEIVVQHRPRTHGASKYGFSRIVKALLDLMLVKYVVTPKIRPEHLLGGAGLTCLGSGALGVLFAAANLCTSRIAGSRFVSPQLESTIFYGSMGLLAVGILLMLFALVGAVLSARLTRQADIYSIAEHTSPLAAASHVAFKASKAP
jgi:glycosyltransferase involved in cell wall biosynthesis